MYRGIKYYFEVLEEMLFIPMNTSNLEVKKIFGAKSSFISQIRAIIGTIKENYSCRVKKNLVLPDNLPESYWFYSVSKNSLNALFPLFNNTREDKIFIRLGNDIKHEEMRIIGLYYPLSLKEIGSALFISTMFVMTKRNARSLWSRSFKSIIALFECRYVVGKFHPKAIFFSNDHGLGSRAMLIAGREKETPTVYLQHACVTNLFPPLGYTVALLEGRDANEKYKVLKNVNCKKYEVGMMKFDQYKNMRNFSKEIRNVCICINLLDDEDTVLKVINFIQNQFPELRLSIRFHPRYEVTKSKLGNLKNVIYSNKNENVFEFLSKHELCISGNSSIHLEAVLMNVISVHYDFDIKFNLGDYYGFLKNKMVLKAGSVEDISNLISKFQFNRPLLWYQRAIYYVQNTEFESSALENATIALQNENFDFFKVGK